MAHQVSTHVYAYNPNGLGMLILFICGVVVLIHELLSMNTLGGGITGSVLLSIFIYVNYMNNSKWKLRVWDERILIFSSDAISFLSDYAH